MQRDFIALKAKLEALKTRQTAQEEILVRLLPSLLDKAFKGEL